MSRREPGRPTRQDNTSTGRGSTSIQGCCKMEVQILAANHIQARHENECPAIDHLHARHEFALLLANLALGQMCTGGQVPGERSVMTILY